MGAKHFPISAIPLTCLVILALNFSKAVGSDSKPKLASHEVEALKVIGKELGMKDWNFTVDPCSGEGNWNLTDRIGYESSVACNCSLDANTTTCHVVSLQLKAQNLAGQLPVELYKLRYLQTLDLSRNILTGTIPSKWATMILVDLSFMGNRLSGPFPKVLTNITTLRNVSIESNQFRGSVPPEIGNLINLIKLTLSSNQFSGKLPAEMAKLTNLTDLRLCDNNFSGNIPDFVGNWTNIEKLHIQGSSLKAPIPASISELTRLSDLRISDLTGSASNFPQLKKMKRMRTLILRNCLIHGHIPEYIGEMEKLKTLDLSFNNLTGPVPDSFTNLDKVDFMYFTGNMLTGAIPGWIIKRNKNVDISYNNFTSDNSSPTECSEGGTVNIVESYSPAANNIRRIHPCLKRDFPCDRSPFYHSLHINCGGRETIVNGTKYEADVESRGASLFYSGQDWALSSTGNFMDNDIDADEYTETNTSVISNVSGHSLELYTTARVSPLALTYYGLCLLTGNYTVKLHFAEIIFKNGSSFDSLGKRMFDVYIQII